MQPNVRSPGTRSRLTTALAGGSRSLAGDRAIGFVSVTRASDRAIERSVTCHQSGFQSPQLPVTLIDFRFQSFSG